MSDELDAAICGAVRAAARRITGGNCTFADDDISVLELLAWAAVRAGFADELIPHMAEKAVAACDAHPFTAEMEQPRLTPTRTLEDIMRKREKPNDFNAPQHQRDQT